MHNWDGLTSGTFFPCRIPFNATFTLRCAESNAGAPARFEIRSTPCCSERTAISKKPEATINAEIDQLRTTDQLTPDLVFRDPYVLDFLGLKDRYLEKDLEDAILRELETFLLELGSGFAFLGRQKRIQIDSDDFYIDLLFYHRGLKRLIAIDLKLGDFQAKDKGQMELYLRWLAKYEQQAGEDAPLGIILCAGKKQEQIELLELGQSGIHVAEYLTALPSQALLQRKLHAAIESRVYGVSPRIHNFSYNLS